MQQELTLGGILTSFDPRTIARPLTESDIFAAVSVVDINQRCNDA